MSEPIAVVGLACRYPDAHGPGRLWHSVLHRRVAFRRMPEERLPREYIGDGDDPDRTYVTHAAVLEGWEFDRARFRVPGPVARAVDHTHWLALETADEVLRDSGFPQAGGLDRARTGVVIGNSLAGEFSRASLLRLRWPFVRRTVAAALAGHVDDDRLPGVLADVEERFKAQFSPVGDETLAGGLSNTIAGRVCNHFDLHGAGYTVDGACSSSLLAVVTACGLLRGGQLDFAIAGGVDLSLDPFELVGFARLGALSRGPMRVYDERPTGFLPGEGCGLVGLMRAGDAARAGARTYALIAGTGMSTDGAGGLTRPERAGQRLACTRAYADAQVDPGDVALFEGHGTGTRVGDSVELDVLAGLRESGAGSAAIGSVKANVGHTKAAAGAAGLMKAVLALHHRVLPPTTGCHRPHERLRSTPALRVLDGPEPWGDAPAVAGVSSSGFGGLNTHVVLLGEPRVRPGRVPGRRRCRPESAPDVLLVTAATPGAALDRLARLAAVGARLSQAELGDCAAALAGGADLAHPFRVALCAATPERLPALAEQAAAALRDAVSSDRPRGLVAPSPDVFAGWGPPPAVGLLFPGQAAPLPVGVERLARVAGPALEGGGEWAARLAGARPEEAVPDTRDAQPLIVAGSLAALRWLDELGVDARVAAGHSLGEIVALAWAGVLGDGEALRLAEARGEVMSRHGRPGTGMTSLAADARAAAGLLDGTAAVIAGLNAPSRTVVAGPLEDLEAVERAAARAGVEATRLPVSHAFHSPAMELVGPALRAALEDFDLRAPAGEVVSTVTGRPLAGEDVASLLVEQLTSPVRFADAAGYLAARCGLLLEVGTGRILTTLLGETVDVPVVPTELDVPERGLARTTAAVAAAGAAATVEPWFAGRGARPFDLARPPRFLAGACEPAAGGSDPAVAVEPAQPADLVPADLVPADLVPADLVPADPGAAVAEARAAAPATGNGDGGDLDALEVLRRRLADSLELDLDVITPDLSLLGDLHLSSLQIVQLVGRAAEDLGKAPPASPLTLADTTVADAASVLADLPADQGAAGAVAAGVAPWVRAFRDRWVPAAPAAGPGAAAYDWEVAGAEHLHGAAPAAAVRRPGRPPALLAVVAGRGDGAVESLYRACQAAVRRPPERVVVAHPDGSGAALARSLHHDLDRAAVASVRCDLEPGSLARALDAVCGLDERFADVALDGSGALTRRVAEPHDLGEAADLPLRPGDVCLVTGGAAGITAECGLALARRTGCSLVVAGRSDPGQQRVRQAVERLAAEAACHYVQADLTEVAGARAAVAAASAHGPVRALLHGAGVNTPARLPDLSAAALREALGPKVDGLRHLLAALDPAGLELVAGFGSIIGRMGLAGQTAYCVANDWLRLELEAFAGEHPGCRVRTIEWAVWSGLGMGVRMGVLDDLARRGVAAVDPEEGTRAFLAAAGTAGAPVTLLVTGRFPASPALEVAGPPLPLLRFLEEIHTRTPGVEVVADARLSVPSDHYLTDHRLDAAVVLPGVVSLEIAAQAAAATDATRTWRRFADVRLTAPVIVDDDRERVVRLAALASGPGHVDVTLRTDEDRFATDRVALRVLELEERPERVLPAAEPPPERSGPHPYYGSLYFHTGRYRRLRAYGHASALRCHAWVDSGAQPHFSAFQPSTVLLGDATTHDACIHVLQACLPHRRVVPVRIEELSVWRQPGGVLQVVAAEREQRGEEYRFDVDVAAADGTPVARWRGLWLRAVGPVDTRVLGHPELAGPYLARRCHELGLPGRPDVLAARSGDPSTWVGVLAGEPVRVRGELGGPLRCDTGYAAAAGGPGGALVAYSATHALGVDAAALPPDGGREQPAPAWQELALALAGKTGEDAERSALRCTVACEALRRAGADPGVAPALADVDGQAVMLAAPGWSVASVALDGVWVAALAVAGEAEA